MKKLILSLMFAAISILQIQAQVGVVSNTADPKSYWQLSPRVGYDFPTYNNNTPFIDYKGGIEAGLSLDKYWRWFGLGFDFDYIKNKPKSTYSTNNLVNAASTPLTAFSLVEKPITRIFFGIGPDLKVQNKTGKLSAELNTRVGLSFIKGGRTLLQETTTVLKEVLNFHAGYDAKSVLAAKIQLRMNYFFSERFGIHLGAYYLRHFKAPELVDPGFGYSARYQPYKTTSPVPGFDGPPISRTQPCNCDISSVGLFAGVTLKLSGKSTAKKGKYTLVVTAKDKYTGALLPGTEVQVKNDLGIAVRTGITNSEGVVVFDKITPENYTISGVLNTITLEGSTVTKNEFLDMKTVKKEILYADRNFIIKGKIFACNSSTPLAGITVVLENIDEAFKKTTITDAQGNFILHLPQAGNFSLYGKKDSYFSQIEEITTSNYNRDKNLFIKLEICAERVDCGKAIGLKNILFDLDKYFIREDAKPELNKLIRFMKDNPTVKVEVGSHTDCRASKEYNQTLSQNRANASVDYIVSKGIARDRISGRGYGESKLLNECADGVNCTEAQHAINRRTEMKVICNNN